MGREPDIAIRHMTWYYSCILSCVRENLNGRSFLRKCFYYNGCEQRHQERNTWGLDVDDMGS